MFYNNLPDILADGASVLREESPLELEERAALALRIDQAMQEKAQAGWKGDQAKESIVKSFLHELMDKDREATLALFDLVKNQPGY